MTATGGLCVSDGCLDFIYNMNYQVVPFVSGTANGSCLITDSEICVPPGAWTEKFPTINCIPPCPMILPPLDHGYDLIVTFSPLTKSIASLSDGSTITKTTTIDLAAGTIDAIFFQRITIGSTETDSTTIWSIQSIMPSSIMVTFGPNEATFAPTPSGSSQSAEFFSTSHTSVIQPQATQSIAIASPTVPSLIFKSAAPTGVCTTGCGTDVCSLFGGCCSDAGSDCGIFGCSGGCGIF